MRRPHPRFDPVRNAWVTRAGGKLKVLAKGPNNSTTEAAAWDVFYVHMAKLGTPVENSALPALTIGQLADKYGEWMQREVEADRMKPRTLDYYQEHIQKFIDAIGGHRPASGVLPHEAEMFKTTWHSLQTVHRLFNWGVTMGLLSQNPVRSVKLPELGQRQRILTPKETAQFFRAADLDFRLFLIAMRQTIARPQEVRALQWKHLTIEPVPAFVLRDFKAKNRRKDRKTAVRIIPLDDRMQRLLSRLARKRRPSPDDHVFLNRNGDPWTSNAVRCRMRRLREKLGLGADENGENIVSYTMRHTSATRATARGVRDKLLAELMGQTNTATTQRYQHLQAEHLADAIRRANGRKAQ
ncbi:MAG: tyrosine-type recombinase/integrase [Planctomycetia bacterium]|nr:tyrosine-type recombinase/integrase [Planctomycetia bacterium]